jgi:hypothetical protein
MKFKTLRLPFQALFGGISDTEKMPTAEKCIRMLVRYIVPSSFPCCSGLQHPFLIQCSLDEYFEDFAKAYREEIQELYSLGCRKISRDVTQTPS